MGPRRRRDDAVVAGRQRLEPLDDHARQQRPQRDAGDGARSDRHRVQQHRRQLPGGRREHELPLRERERRPLRADEPAGRARRRGSAGGRRPSDLQGTGARGHRRRREALRDRLPQRQGRRLRHPLARSQPPGGFTDPQIPAGYAPYGIQTTGNRIFVSYAQQDADREDEIPGAGKGYVDAFDFDGTLLGRVASRRRSARRGASPRRRRTSASSAATTWSATSATGASTPTRRPRPASGRLDGTLQAAGGPARSRSTACGRSSSASAASTPTAPPTRCTSPPARSARRRRVRAHRRLRAAQRDRQRAGAARALRSATRPRSASSRRATAGDYTASTTADRHLHGGRRRR